MRVRLPFLLAPLILAGAALAQEAGGLRAAADKLMKRGKFAEALELLEKAIQERPEGSELIYLRAVCLGQLGKHEAAVEAVTRAIQLNESLARAYGERAYNLYRLGRREAALKDYDRCLELDPRNIMGHGERGDLLLELGRYRDAMAAFDRAIELAPGWSNAHSQRGYAAAEIGEYEQANESFTHAIALAPDDHYAAERLAGVLFEMGEDDHALHVLQTLARATKSYHFLMLRGRLAFQLGRYDLARQELQKAVDRGDPAAQGNARLSLASIALAEGQYATARELLEFDPPDELQVFVPWFALMTWCAERHTATPAEAAATLRKTLAEAASHDPLIAKLAQACIADEPPPPPVPGEVRAFDACPQLFFAGWRALAEGDAQRGEQLLLQCVNTGETSYQQWQLARDLLTRRVGAERLERDTGAEFAVEGTGDDQRIVVRSVRSDPPGAAALQDLRAGDVIERVCDLPASLDELHARLRPYRVGSGVLLAIRRGDQRFQRMFRPGWRRKAR